MGDYPFGFETRLSFKGEFHIKPRIISVLAVLHFIFSPSVYSRAWTLKEIQSRAVENSPILQMRARDLESDQYRTRGSGLLPNPSTYIQLGSVSSAGSSGMTWDVTLNQTIPFPTKLSSQRRIHEFQEQLSLANQAEAKVLVQHSATLSAVRVQMLGELAKHSKERRRRYGLIQDYLRTHPHASPIQRVESTLIGNQIKLLERGILELQQEYTSAQIELESYLRIDEPLDVVFTWDKAPVLPPKDQIAADLFQKNWEWKRKHLEVGRAEEIYHRAKLDPIPDFVIGFNYRIEQLPPPNIFFSGAFGFSIPVWDRGQYTIPSAQARREAEHSRQEVLRIDIQKRFQQAYVSAETASKIVHEFPISLAAESEAEFQRAETEFRKGRLQVTSFFQADSQIHETIETIYQSRYQYLDRLSQVLLFLGSQLEWG